MKKINDKFVPKNPYTLLQYINELYSYYNNLIEDGRKDNVDETYKLITFFESEYTKMLYSEER